VLLSRLHLISISRDGDPTLTDDGAAYLRVAEEISAVERFDAASAQQGSSDPIVIDGPLPLHHLSSASTGQSKELRPEPHSFSESRL